MGYPRDLDEYTDQEIQTEWERRLAVAKEGKCTYCKDPREICKCKMHGRTGMIERLAFDLVPTDIPLFAGEDYKEWSNRNDLDLD